MDRFYLIFFFTEKGQSWLEVVINGRFIKALIQRVIHVNVKHALLAGDFQQFFFESVELEP